MLTFSCHSLNLVVLPLTWSSFPPLTTFHSPLAILSSKFSLADGILTSLFVILHIWLEQNNELKGIRKGAQQNHSFKINSIHIPASAVLSSYGLVRISSKIRNQHRKSQHRGWFYISSNLVLLEGKWKGNLNWRKLFTDHCSSNILHIFAHWEGKCNVSQAGR